MNDSDSSLEQLTKQLNVLQDKILLLEKLLEDQRQTKEALAASEKNLSAMLETNADGIVIVNTNGIVLYVNPANEMLFGRGKVDFIGFPFGFPVSTDCPKDTLIIKKDGVLCDVEMKIVPILWELKPAYLLCFHDITERRKKNTELILAKERAEENSMLKSALLNNMSHEIRTPMNAIIGFSDLMKDANAEDKNSYAEIVSSCSHQLLSLIDDVILLSRLQSEKMVLNINELKPAAFIHEILEMFNYLNLKKEIIISESIPAQYINLVIKADEKKIRQVLTNFISNAMKYTFEGFIVVGFDIKKDEIEFFVKDSGIGISVKEQNLIFDTFYRGEQAISKAIRGTGLGLNIAKGLIEKMGGKIGVDSELIKGFRFYFTVPIEKSDFKSITNSPKPAIPHDTKNISLLIVDDELYNCQYLEILLKGKVKKIDHAYNGKEAVEKVSLNKYDVVLMDLKMPVMDGTEATKILRTLYPELVIIAQTAYILPEEKLEVLQVGFNGFLQKPIKRAALMKLIGKY